MTIRRTAAAIPIPPDGIPSTSGSRPYYGTPTSENSLGKPSADKEYKAITHIPVITGVEETTRARNEPHPLSLTVEDAFTETDVAISGAAKTTRESCHRLPHERRNRE